jgi:hypothetical protein
LTARCFQGIAHDRSRCADRRSNPYQITLLLQSLRHVAEHADLDAHETGINPGKTDLDFEH